MGYHSAMVFSHEYTNNMVYIFFTVFKESRKNVYSRRDLNLGPRPKSKPNDLDRMAIGPIVVKLLIMLSI